MITNYYNASNNFSAPIRREPKPFRPQNAASEPAAKILEKHEITHKKNGGFEKLDADSILIMGLVLLLLFSGCNDTLLLIALGYLLFF